MQDGGRGQCRGRSLDFIDVEGFLGICVLSNVGTVRTVRTIAFWPPRIVGKHDVIVVDARTHAFAFVEGLDDALWKLVAIH